MQYIHLYTNNSFSNTYAIFHMQIMSQLFASNQLKHLNIQFIENQFNNITMIVRLEIREIEWRTNSKMETKERVEEQTKKLVTL